MPEENSPDDPIKPSKDPQQGSGKIIVNHHAKPVKKRHKLKIIVFTSILLLILGIILIPAIYLYWFLTSFSQAAGITPNEFISDIKAGYTQQTPQRNPLNLLVLGIDEIPGQKDGSLLTDTMIFASLDTQDNSIALLPLPRDLWLQSYQTKINALYYYGQTDEDKNGVEFASNTLSQVIGQPIDHTVVLNLNTLKSIIDVLGGVEIDVPQAFSDDQYPRSDVDVTKVTDPELLYQTISFDQGLQLMSGETAIKYIRSRQSQNAEIGNDLSRSFRQQQLILAILNKLTTKEVLTNPNTLGSIYKIYLTQINTSLTTQELVALAKTNHKQLPQLKNLSIPVQNEDEQGIIFHPDTHSSNQWVFVPVDPSWEEFKQFISENLSSAD